MAAERIGHRPGQREGSDGPPPEAVRHTGSRVHRPQHRTQPLARGHGTRRHRHVPRLALRPGHQHMRHGQRTPVLADQQDRGRLGAGYREGLRRHPTGDTAEIALRCDGGRQVHEPLERSLHQPHRHGEGVDLLHQGSSRAVAAHVESEDRGGLVAQAPQGPGDPAGRQPQQRQDHEQGQAEEREGLADDGPGFGQDFVFRYGQHQEQLKPADRHDRADRGHPVPAVERRHRLAEIQHRQHPVGAVDQPVDRGGVEIAQMGQADRAAGGLPHIAGVAVVGQYRAVGIDQGQFLGRRDVGLPEQPVQLRQGDVEPDDTVARLHRDGDGDPGCLHEAKIVGPGRSDVARRHRIPVPGPQPRIVVDVPQPRAGQLHPLPVLEHADAQRGPGTRQGQIVDHVDGAFGRPQDRHHGRIVGCPQDEEVTIVVAVLDRGDLGMGVEGRPHGGEEHLSAGPGAGTRRRSQRPLPGQGADRLDPMPDGDVHLPLGGDHDPIGGAYQHLRGGSDIDQDQHRHEGAEQYREDQCDRHRQRGLHEEAHRLPPPRSAAGAVRTGSVRLRRLRRQRIACIPASGYIQ